MSQSPYHQGAPRWVGEVPLFISHFLLRQKDPGVPKRTVQIPRESDSPLVSGSPTQSFLERCSCVPGFVPGTEQGSECGFWNDPTSDSVLLF